MTASIAASESWRSGDAKCSALSTTAPQTNVADRGGQADPDQMHVVEEPAACAPATIRALRPASG